MVLKKWPILVLIFIVIISCLPLFKNIHNINAHLDWHQMLSYYRADRQAVMEYKQIPLRTHYFGGGYPLMANPQDGALNLLFFPVLIFGEVVGMKINVFLAHMAAALGMYYLARHVLRYHALGALFSAACFLLAGRTHLSLVRGDDYVAGVYAFFMPLALALFIRSKEKKAFLFACVFLLASMAVQAGSYFMPCALFLFLFSAPRALKHFFIVFILVFLLGAAKFFPMIELLLRNPRVTGGYNPFLGNIWHGLFIDAGFLAGTVAVAFAFFSLARYPRENARLVILFVVFSLLAFAGHTHFDLFRYLARLPLFNAIDTPARYFAPVNIFIIALIGGRAFSILDSKKQVFFPAFLAAVVVVWTSWLLIKGMPREAYFNVPVVSTQRVEFFQVKNTGPSRISSDLIPERMRKTRSWEWTRPTQYELMLSNIGKVNSYVNIHLGEYAEPKYFVREEADPLNIGRNSWQFNPGYKGEVYFLASKANKASLRYFSPNKIVAEASLSEPDVLVINQNFERHWRSDKGDVRDNSGLLSVRLRDIGSYKVEFSYVLLPFHYGLAVSLLAFACLILICRKEQKEAI